AQFAPTKPLRSEPDASPIPASTPLAPSSSDQAVGDETIDQPLLAPTDVALAGEVRASQPLTKLPASASETNSSLSAPPQDQRTDHLLAHPTDEVSVRNLIRQPLKVTGELQPLSAETTILDGDMSFATIEATTTEQIALSETAATEPSAVELTSFDTNTEPAIVETSFQAAEHASAKAQSALVKPAGESTETLLAKSSNPETTLASGDAWAEAVDHANHFGNADTGHNASDQEQADLSFSNHAFGVSGSLARSTSTSHTTSFGQVISDQISMAEQAASVRNQIVEGLHNANIARRGETTRLELRLDPPELGTVKVSLEHSRKGMSARLEFDQAQTRQMVEQNMSSLRDALDNAGIAFEDFSMSWNGEQQSSFTAGDTKTPWNPDDTADQWPEEPSSVTTAESIHNQSRRLNLLA
ncbi:MAG: flagellar hook-length control protein FliK, partial [Planctomycetales bacterium]|nr:flagellar hook-length control protein FliK [Planctomycetales bacterium]